MVRPKDLPQPVRMHRSHESYEDKMRANRAPGPGAYRGKYVSDEPKSRILGCMPKAMRFKKEQLVPEDHMLQTHRENVLDNPGPAHHLKFQDTKIATTFGTGPTGRGNDENGKNSGPGPGAYESSNDWSKGVSFTRGTRSSLSTSGVMDKGAAPGTYTPEKPRTRNVAVSIARAKRDYNPSEGRRVGKDAAPYTGLGAIDRTLQYTDRHPVPGISFAMAGRSSSAHSGNDVGPGAYDIRRAARITDRHNRAGRFGTAKRAVSATTQRGGAGQNGPQYVVLPRPDITSDRGTSPSIGFGKAVYDRGVPNDADPEPPTAGYHPSIAATKPDTRTVTLAKAGRPASAPAVQSDGAAAAAKDAALSPVTGTNDGPRISFTQSTRQASLTDQLSSKVPGPGAYRQTLPPKKTNAGVSFTRGGKRFDAAYKQESPGPKYNPDYKAGKRPVSYDVSFTQSKRDASPRNATPHATSYSPMYNHVSRGGRSAILYLTG